MVTDITSLHRDVVGVLKLQRGSIDMAYLEQLARELGLTDLLDRCVEDAARPG